MKDIICNAYYSAFYAQPIHRPMKYGGRFDDNKLPAEWPPDDTWPPTLEQLESGANQKRINEPRNP